jgi:microcin C transport system substrate-binding protein
VKPTRRTVVKTAGLALVAPAFGVLGQAASSGPARAQEQTWRHGLSLFGDLKYPPGFRHLDYVNPEAVKTGTVRLQAPGTFDNFNPVVSGVKGSLGGGSAYVFDTLMTETLDEASSVYGLLAEAVSYPSDFSYAIYRLRQEARWHDGMPVTPEDVIFSFDAFKKNDPRQSAYYRHVTKAEKTGEREITFTFDEPGNRELPQILGQLMVLPKHWWEGSDASGKKRDVAATTLEPLLGSGPYRLKEFVAGRSVVLERVKDYWAKDLNVNVGQYNFDELRFEYFRDGLVALEAFKADQVDFRMENSAKRWATEYVFPARDEERVILEEFPIRNIGWAQGFAFNTRREKFKDARLRRAFNFAFDFEEMNKQFFYSQYHRVGSYFDGTELAWNWKPDPNEPTGGSFAIASAPSGLPAGLELEILATVRDKVPPEVFTAPYTNPVGGNPEATRANLREATRLAKEAGFEIRDKLLVNAKTGEPMNVEFLNDQPDFERVILFFKTSLERLGIGVTVRTVDSSQYENRLRNWDFDIITTMWLESLSPGNEQRDFWGSQAADSPGSRNLVGIKNPAVDALIDRVIFAKSRPELVAATRALDRVLLWNYYIVPQFNYPKDRTARWDRFGRPNVMPKYGFSAFPLVWWWDAERAMKVGSRQ